MPRMGLSNTQYRDSPIWGKYFLGHLFYKPTAPMGQSPTLYSIQKRCGYTVASKRGRNFVKNE